MTNFYKYFGEFIEISKKILLEYQKESGALQCDDVLDSLTNLSKIKISDSNETKLKNCFEYIYIQNNVKSNIKNFKTWIVGECSSDKKEVILEYGKIKKIEGKFKFKKESKEAIFILLNLTEIYNRLIRLIKIFSTNNEFNSLQMCYRESIYRLFEISCENLEDINIIQNYFKETIEESSNDNYNAFNKDNLENFKKLMPTLLQSIGGIIPGGLDGLKDIGLDSNKLNQLLDGVYTTLGKKDIQDNIGNTMQSNSEPGISGMMNGMMKLLADGNIIKDIAKSMDLPEDTFKGANFENDIKEAGGAIGNIIPMIQNMGNMSNTDKVNTSEKMQESINSMMKNVNIPSSSGTPDPLLISLPVSSSSQTSKPTEEEEEEEEDYPVN